MGKGYRQGRIGEEIRRIISEMLLSDLKDPRLDSMISITDVEVTKDNSYATVYTAWRDRKRRGTAGQTGRSPGGVQQGQRLHQKPDWP